MAKTTEKKSEERAATDKKPSVLEQLGEKRKETMEYAPKVKPSGRNIPEAAL